MGGFPLNADLSPAKGVRNILVTASEADSSSSSGFKVARATSKLWNCLAMGGMVISHTWLFALVLSTRLVPNANVSTHPAQVHGGWQSCQPRALHHIPSPRVHICTPERLANIR
jgi:hypothetical protein